MSILSWVRSICVGTLAVAAIVALSGRTSTAATYNWQGNTLTGTWNTVGATGWDGGPPNAAGDVAQRVTAITGDVLITQSVNDVTIGGVTIGNGSDLGNFYFEIDFATARVLNLNNSGAGATIEYNNTNTGTAAQLWFGGAGSMNLQDNLKINVVPNLTGTSASGGMVALVTPITGTGNITVNSNQAIPSYSISSLGQVQPAVSFQKASTYVGTTTIEKGAVQYTTGTSFGNAANMIQLGVAGADSAALGSTNVTMTLANPITVGPSSGSNTGTLTIARPSSSASGVNTYSGNVTLNSNVNIVSNSTAENQIFTGAISGSGGVIFTSGLFNPGRTSFRGTNTYAGDTMINGQTLLIRNGAAIPNGTSTGNVSIGATATLILRGPETINGLSGSGTITSTTLASTLTLGDNDASGTFSGSILPGTGTTAIAKIGSGTQTLSGANTYTGTTTVSAGTLLVNGTHAGGGLYTVTGGTLGGTGTIGSSVSLVGGTLAPGASVGTLNIGSSLTLTTGTFDWEFNNSADGDVANVNGTLAIASATTLNGINPGAAVLAGTKLILITYATAGSPGNFNLMPDESFVLVGGQYSRINYDDTSFATAANFGRVGFGNGNAVTLTAVPEASSILVMGLGGAFAIGAVWLGKRFGIVLVK